MEVNDKVFGKMMFDYGWTKKEEIELFGRKYEISCIASAYTGKEIDDVQRKMYADYLKENSRIIKEIENAISDYCKKQDIVYSDGIASHIKPTELVFQKNGKAGLIFDCDWDMETGIVAIFEPEISVESPDDFL